MKISRDWLAAFVDKLPAADVIGEALTMGGLPVEHFDTHGDDITLDVEVTSNRSDCLSHQGVGREVAALLGLPFKPVSIRSFDSKDAAPFTVRIDQPSLCPHYTGRLVRGIKVGPSPAWLVKRLESVGLRSINNIVDITNFVLFELGQPLHAFDFATLAGRQIIVRTAVPGETLLTLDGVTRKLDASMLVIADAEKPVALAGVMGGEDTGVTERTVDLLLESARFDPLCIRKTARSLSMMSDSSYRFERGIDPTLPKRASDRAIELILDIAGGQVVGPIVEAGHDGYTPTTITMRLATLRRLLGVNWDAKTCVDALAKLGFNPQAGGEIIAVDVPSHRLDVRIEADVVEEIARVVGYEKIPTRSDVPIILQPRDDRRAAIELIRRTLNAAGFYEALTFGFVADKLAPLFTHADAKQLHTIDPRTRKADNQLRPSVLPGLLESIRLNENVGTDGAKLFEIASAFWIDEKGRSVERRCVGIVGDGDFSSLKGSVEKLLRTLDARRTVRVEPADRTGFGRGACGKIVWGDAEIGYLGMSDRGVVDALGLNGRLAMAELWLEPLVAGTQHVPQLRPLPRFPAVWRDLSFVVPETVRYEQIESSIARLHLDHLESIEFVTTYRGKQIEPGKKSVTLTLCFRSPSETLTSEAVEAQVRRAVESTTNSLGATLRV